MSTITPRGNVSSPETVEEHRHDAPVSPATATPPPLVEGQRLDQPTFHARYEAMPPGTQAELIDGVVIMPSPLGHPHGRSHSATSHWLTCYEEKTPGVEVLDNTSTILGPRSELQPDLQLRVLTECGGRSQADPTFIRGVPELVVEVAHASRYVDLGPKLDDYERAGVLEYVVRALDPDEVAWYVLQEGRLVKTPPDADGLYRSRAFPGLWLDPRALLARDLRRLREVIDLGAAAPDQAAFVAKLAEAKAQAGPTA